MAAYISALAAAAVLCAIATVLSGEDSGAGKVVKLMASVFMAVCILKPVLHIDLGAYSDYAFEINADASNIVSQGESEARDALSDIIMAQTRAYILDKATQLGAQLTVQLQLTEDALPVPESVTLRGNFSPYARQRLTVILEEDLGIGREEQLWIAQG